MSLAAGAAPAATGRAHPTAAAGEQRAWLPPVRWSCAARVAPGRRAVHAAVLLIVVIEAALCPLCAAGSSATAVCVGASCAARRAAPQYARLDLMMRGNDPYVRLVPTGSAACAAERKGRDACLSASGAKSVVDFTCLHVWPHAHFHRLVDCAVPNFELFEAAEASKEALHIVPHAMQPFLDLLGLNETRRVNLNYAHGDSNSTCVCIDADASVRYETRTLGTAHELNARAMRFRERVWRAVGLQQVLSQHGTLLFMSRRGARELQNEPDVVVALKKNVPGLKLATYYGNETLSETVSLFAGARVVFGFHGAGHGNAVFCRNDTLIVEVTLLNEAQPAIWRSNNKVSTIHGRLKWRVHALPLDGESVPGWDSQNKSIRGKDDVLQNERLVRIPPAQLLNIVNVIRADLGLDATYRLL